MTTVCLEDIQAAARRISSTCLRTPVLALLPRDSNPALLLKAESLQPTGAFKLRGATNAIALLTAEQRAAGVVTHSSGNHAQAIASAASAAGIRAEVVMPIGSPTIKVEATERLGAVVTLVPAEFRAAACQDIADRTGAHVIAPYDDARVIAGQGTIGLEILEQVPDVESVLVPVGGGGLISGIAVAIKVLRPDVRVIAVEPELAGDLAEGFARRRIARWTAEQTSRTIADGVRTQQVGELNWEIISALVDDAMTVSEEQIRSAVRIIFSGARIVAEPSGAVSTAGYFAHAERLGLGRTVAVVSGGNVDPASFAELLSRGPLP